jgi:hypothetical protein
VKVEAQEEEEERRSVAIDVGGKNINMALNELAMINRHAAFTSLLLTSYTFQQQCFGSGLIDSRSVSMILG